MKKTRDATAIYYAAPPDGHKPSFECRGYQILQEIPVKPFKGESDLDHEQIWSMLCELYKGRCELKHQARCLQKRRPAMKRESDWEHRINRKRRLIAQVLRRQARLNLAEVCRVTGCCFSTAKRLHRDLGFQGEPAEYTYNNCKTAEETAKVEELIEKVQGSYQTISDLKRALPSFSRKLIARKLKESGHRWLQMVKRRKVPKEESHQSKAIVDLVSHLTQAMIAPSTDVLYVDEVHFPLEQTATHHWTRPELAEEQVYNRREVQPAKLSVIAICSLSGFVAAQVFKQDISMDDFLFFLQSVLSQYAPGRRITVLADNATWHTTPKVVGTKAGKCLFFNIPGLFQANIIENAFSFIRAEFRKRQLVETLEEEALQLAHIFFQQENSARFLGIHRNHLRSLMNLLLKHSNKLTHITEIPQY